MKIQSGKTFIIVALVISVVMPFSVFAAPSAGIKPSSIFYFLDIAAERVGLFFTFNSEKKVRKALEYADERLAEVEAVAGDNNTEAVKTAITNYESSIALATEKSKNIGEKEKAEALLTTISDSTSRHQEVLADVLAKVPDEAKEAITKAIEASRKGQEEALQKIAELKGEVEQLKQEVAELKSKDEKRAKVIEELSKRKPQITPTPASIPVQPPTSKTPEIAPNPKQETTSQAQTKTDKPQVTLPANQIQDNSVSVTPPPPSPMPSSITPTPPVNQTVMLEIASINVVPDLYSATIEWQTNIPANSKIFISGGVTKVYNSESGISTRHLVHVTGLSSGTNYLFEVEAIVNDQVVKKQDSFTTKSGELTTSVEFATSVDKTSIPLISWSFARLAISYTEDGKFKPVIIGISSTDGFTGEGRIFSSANNESCPDGVYCNACVTSTTCNVLIDYHPKSIGNQTLTVTAKGVVKTVDIKVVEYVKIDPAIRDVFSSSSIFEINSTEEKSIGSFKFSQADESIKFEGYDYKYESDIQKKGFLRIIQAGEGYQLRVTPKTNTYALAPGIHSVKITEIKVVGMSSGSYRFITGLPITFTFEIQDIPNPEIIPIKTTNTHNVVNETSWPPLDPGAIGSFNVKYVTNRCIKIESYNVRIENETKNSFSGGIGGGTCVVGGTGMSSDTDSNGITKIPFNLIVNNLLMDGVTNRSWNYRATNLPISVGKVKFYIENLKIKDNTTGIIKDVLNPPVFELEIVIPYY